MEIQSNTTDKKQSSKTRVKVAIRARPMLPREMTGDYRPCVQIKSDSEIIIGFDKLLGNDKNNCREYKYDRVFKQDSPQNEVYEHCIRDLVISCFEGYNAAVLAYGQTGSGKTYTMGTAVTTLSDTQRLGIIPRVINQIFSQVQQRRPNTFITVTVSYIQLYNQQIVDLLADSQFKAKNQSIAIKEDKDSGLVNVEGVVKQNVTTPQQMRRLLQRGGNHRTTKHTNMNDVSSRSHAIFTIFIDSEPIKNEKLDKKDQGISGITHSRFFFADLAGSERAKKTGATGDTLKQGININLGLLQLGNVISALSSIDKNKDQFITFRNSKLTRILQDALGGNSNTYMIACVSPAESNYEQSLNTLKYALKAMNIKNTPVINRNKSDMLRQENIDLKAQNRRLKQMLAQKGVRIDLEEEKPDLMAMESKLLREENRMLSRRYNQALVELQKTKHKLNELEIKIFDIRKEKDIMQINFEELIKENPLLAEGLLALNLRQKFEENEQDKLSIVEKYLEQIQHLQGKFMDKQNIYSHLQSQYNTLLEKSKKDDKLLVKKQIMLYEIGRQNNRLRQQITRLNSASREEAAILQDATLGEQTINQELQMMLEEAEAVQNDDIIKEEQEDYSKKEQQTKERLNEVDNYILEKQQFLQKISKEQISMSNQLISSMKNQYQQKIELLEKEKRQMMKQRDQSGTVQKSKFINKVQNLQNELKDYRKKARDQRNMQKLVQNQTSKIKDLAEEIKKFKMQKMQLYRKLKQDKDNFQKLKNKRVKDLLIAKKQNMKKQNDIRKQRLKNFKAEQTVKRKDQQIKRIKRVNEALKNIVKPANRNIHAGGKRENFSTLPQDANSQDIRNFDKLQQDLIFRIKKEYLIEIQRQQLKTDLQMRLQQSEQQLMILVNDEASNRIKLQRIELKDPEELIQDDLVEKSHLELTIRSYEEDIKNLQAYIVQLQQAPQHTTSIDYFDIEAAIIYSKNYESIDALRSFIKALNTAFKNLLYQNCRIISQRKKDEAEIEGLKAEIFDYREKIMSLNAQMQRILNQNKEEMMMNRYYTSQEPETLSVGLKRLDQKQKREMERKVQDLAKNNRQMANQLQKTRRKCQIVQQKYQSIKNLVSKDKNIGRQQEPNFTKPQKKLEKQVSNRQMLDELDSMTESIDRLKKVKSFTSFQECVNQQSNAGTDLQSLNRWQCIWKQDAHSSGALSITVHSNFLISTATKSIKIWDLQSRKSIAELPAVAAVKYVMIDPDRRLFFTACEKSVTIWDLISLQIQGVMKCHKDQVRVIHNAGDYIFTGGKGSPNGGSLLVWDLRKLNPNQALQEKQKNQDIFTFTSHQNILYYGTRNHSVRRMEIGSWDVLSPFQPPHLDSVTGLTVVGNRLISGSKDKHLRLWSLDQTVSNNKHTFHAFNDYVTTVQSSVNHPLFYAGSKDGQVKACYLKNDRIQALGGIMAHTQSINSICTLDENPYSLITASQDRMIKLWHPTKETIENIARQNYF